MSIKSLPGEGKTSITVCGMTYPTVRLVVGPWTTSLEALQLEHWLSVGCYSVLSIRSSVRVVDVDVADVALVVVSVDVVDVADVEVALVVVSVVDVADVEVALVVSVVVVVVVCTKISGRFGHFNKLQSQTTLGYSSKRLFVARDRK